MFTGARGMIGVLLLCCSVSIAGCEGWTQRGAKGTELLPKASPGERNFSSYQPKNPYEQLAAGIMTRTLFEASSGTGYRVVVDDLLVGPGKHSESVSLPGMAVLEVRSGNGLITIGRGKPRDLKLGSTFTLPEGESFAIDNKAEDAIAIRVHVFKAE